jgi:hypothetical protein
MFPILTGSGRAALAAAAGFLWSTAALAGEGMWPFDAPPLAQVRERLGVTLTPDWLQRLQHSTVHLGASASFVSQRGLLLTNHHVVMGCLNELSTAQRDLVGPGYLARNERAELRCPGATARVLVSSDDVSAVVAAALTGESGEAQVNARRKATLAEIERSCRQASRLHCEVVPLYQGALHHLYRYQEWTDVRLVFAPEYQAGAYGGDPDNFVYPRFALDFALLRVYEQGRPVQPRHALKLATQPVAEGDPVFLAGHPGRTDRLHTLAQLRTLRDTLLPLRLASAGAQRADLLRYSARSAEAARQALDRLSGTENWLKAMEGETAALQDAKLFARRTEEETALRAAHAERGLAGDPWADVEAATAAEADRAKELWAVGYGYHTQFELAGKLVELVHERGLPDAERLEGYRDSALAALERRLLAERPVYPAFEAMVLAGLLQEARQLLGDAHPYVQAALEGDSPEVAAQRLIGGSRVAEVAQRQALLDGGLAAVQASTDALIVLARTVYTLRRELARWREEQVDTPIRNGLDRIGQARFQIHGRSLAPDATGTLRLSFGKALGYTSQGIAMPWKTTFGGLLARADSFDHHAPFDLSARTRQARDRLDPRQALNFVTTLDGTGGNSGSPVVNTRGEWVGVYFDTNLEGLGGRFAYSDERARGVVLHAGAILHALERIYRASGLVRELQGR